MTDDPGWFFSQARGSGNPPSVLSGLRIIYVALVTGVVVFTVVCCLLVATGTPPEDPPIGMAVGVVVVTLAALLLRPRIAPKLVTTDEDALRRSYQARLIVRMALGEGPVLFAIVVFLLTFAWWMLAVVVVVGVVGLVPPAPTRAAIEADQERLVDQGSGLSLLHALTQPLGNTRRP